MGGLFKFFHKKRSRWKNSSVGWSTRVQLVPLPCPVCRLVKGGEPCWSQGGYFEVIAKSPNSEKNIYTLFEVLWKACKDQIVLLFFGGPRRTLMKVSQIHGEKRVSATWKFMQAAFFVGIKCWGWRCETHLGTNPLQPGCNRHHQDWV